MAIHEMLLMHYKIKKRTRKARMMLLIPWLVGKIIGGIWDFRQMLLSFRFIGEN